VDRFAERVAEYRASVHDVAADEVAHRIVVLARERGARRIAVAPGVPEDWRPDGIELAVDTGLAASALDRLDGALSGCALAIAETGTLVLDGGPRCGRRALTLVPDWHVCVVEAEQVVGSVPEAIAALHEAATDGRPLTFVSGPSATSDIELRRVEGVHGPRTLDVVLVAPNG
jgi:L-lactate dehydrogenase complex protein LldG